jgi:hypothetical protein
LLVVCALLVISAVAPSARAADPVPAPTPGTGAAEPEYVDTELSNETTLSRWAFVDVAVWARAEPDGNARRVKKLTTRTPDRTSELVLTLTERRFANGIKWVKVRLPMRPNNTTGWVPRRVLSDYRVTRNQMVIDTGSKWARLYKKGKLIWKARVGVGQRKWPTPTGNFYVRDKLIVRNARGPYGPFAFGLSAYSEKLSDWPGGGMVGIHGTNQPGLIPGRISHGCVRVKNGKIRKLERKLTVGTPVLIK